MLEKVRFLMSTKECSKVEIVLVLVPALSYQAYFTRNECESLAKRLSLISEHFRPYVPQDLLEEEL